MALDQSALLGELKLTDVTDRILVLTPTENEAKKPPSPFGTASTREASGWTYSISVALDVPHTGIEVRRWLERAVHASTNICADEFEK